MKTPPKKQNNGKKTAGAILWLVFLALVGFLNSGSLPDIRLPRLPSLPAIGIAGVWIAVAGVLILAVAVYAIVTLRKKNAAATQEDCHDRLHPEHASACPDRLTHWKRQLDGFLAAGLIDKEEYRVLLEKYSRETE